MALRFTSTATSLDGTAPMVQTPLTMAAWCRKSTSDPLYACSLGSNDGNNMFGLLVGGDAQNKVRCNIRAAGIWREVRTTVDYNTGAWFHAAAVFHSSTLRRVYINGGGVGTNSQSSNPQSVSKVRIVQRPGWSPASLEGDLAEVAIWNTALSATELSLLATGISPLLLRLRLANMVLYQDLIRPLNHPGWGGTVTQTGSASAVEHPRICSARFGNVAAVESSLWRLPIQSGARQIAQAGADAAATFLSGATVGAILPEAEVAK